MTEFEKRYWDSFERMYKLLVSGDVGIEVDKAINTMSNIYFNKIKNEKELKKRIIQSSCWTKKECYKEEASKLLEAEVNEVDVYIKKNKLTKKYESIRKFHYNTRKLEFLEKKFILEHLIPFIVYNDSISPYGFFHTLMAYHRWEVRESEIYTTRTKKILYLGSNRFSGDMSLEWLKKRKRIKKVRGGKEIFRDKKHFEKFNNVCFNCGSEENLVLDHHLPCKLGGSNNVENIVVLCNTCNSKKSAKHPTEFYASEKLEELRTKYGIR